MPDAVFATKRYVYTQCNLKNVRRVENQIFQQTLAMLRMQKGKKLIMKGVLLLKQFRRVQ